MLGACGKAKAVARQPSGPVDTQPWIGSSSVVAGQHTGSWNASPSFRQPLSSVYGCLCGNRSVGLLNPSYQLSAEGLQQQAISPQVVHVVRCARNEQAWTLEQLVRSGTLASILCCAEAPYQTKQLRRLHLAAQDVGCQLVIIRHSAAGNLPSPAPTRWSLTRDADGLHLHVSKQAGRPPVTLCVPTSPNRPLACPPARRRVALLDTKTLQ